MRGTYSFRENHPQYGHPGRRQPFHRDRTGRGRNVLPDHSLRKPPAGPGDDRILLAPGTKRAEIPWSVCALPPYLAGWNASFQLSSRSENCTGLRIGKPSGHPGHFM